MTVCYTHIIVTELKIINIIYTLYLNHHTLKKTSYKLNITQTVTSTTTIFKVYKSWARVPVPLLGTNFCENTLFNPLKANCLCKESITLGNLPFLISRQAKFGCKLLFPVNEGKCLPKRPK